MKKFVMVISLLVYVLPICSTDEGWKSRGAKKKAVVEKNKHSHYKPTSWRSKGKIGYFKDRENFVGDALDPQAAELAALEKEYRGKDRDGRYPQHQFLFLKDHYEKSFYEDRTREYVQKLSLKELDKKDFNGQTPLAIAAWMGKVGCVRYLVEAGCDVNSVGFKENRTILHSMIRNAKNAPVHELNTGFWTNDKINTRPSYKALLDVAKALNKNKMLDVNAKDANGKTAYDWLLSYGDTRIKYDKNRSCVSTALHGEELEARKMLLKCIKPKK